MTASQVKLTLIAAVNTKYFAIKPPNGGTPANDKPAITRAKLDHGIFLPTPAKSSSVLKPCLFMMPTAMNASAVVKPPMRKKYKLPAKPSWVALVMATRL